MTKYNLSVIIIIYSYRKEITKMHMYEIDEVIKASPAIQIQSRITHLQRRAWNLLLANAYHELPSTDIHRISMSDLARSLGYDSNDLDHLKETLEALVDYTVKWNILGKDRHDVWGVAALLASAEIEDGICTYGFAPHLRLKLYNPRIYTKINLRLQNEFSSRYAVILWEVCYDYFDIARHEGETPFMSIAQFRDLMGLENDEYPTYKVLNRDVIKASMKEINELTNFRIEVETKREGRSVSELKFRITRMEELPTFEPAEEDVETTQTSLFVDMEELSPIAVKLIQAGVSHKEARRIATQQWDAVDKNAHPIYTDDFDEYVEEKIGLSLFKTDLRNAGGFIVSAICDNYQDPEYQEKLYEKSHRDRVAMIQSLRKEMLQNKHAAVKQAIKENPELIDKASVKVTSEFSKDVLAHYNSPREAYKASGMYFGDINAIVAREFIPDQIAKITEYYETQIARLEEK